MDRKIQLKHPLGKKPVSMNREKYLLLKSHLLEFLRTRHQVTFSDMARAIQKDFKVNNIQFQGSIPWHLEWVKLDLEARNIIERIDATAPQQYRMLC